MSGCHFPRFLSHGKAREACHYPSRQTISGELSGSYEMRHLMRWAPSSQSHLRSTARPDPQRPFPSSIWSSPLGISQSSRPGFESSATWTTREKFTGGCRPAGAEVRSPLGVSIALGAGETGGEETCCPSFSSKSMALWDLKPLSGEVSKVAIKPKIKREADPGEAMSLCSRGRKPVWASQC